MANRTVRTGSFVDAQLMVPFPVHSVPGKVEEISVRPESGESWATVRSVHRLPGVTIRAKQYTLDWFGFFGTPNKLLFTHSNRHRWGLYGPTTPLRLGHRPAFHGTDFSGQEAAALASLMTNIEVRVLKGQLGPKTMARLLRKILPIHPRQARLLAKRPLCLWSWSLRAGRTPNSRLRSVETHLRWYGNPEQGLTRWQDKARIPKLPGWNFDSVGVYRAPFASPSIFHVLYRSSDLHTTLEAGLEAGGPRAEELVRRPYPPLFEEGAVEVPGARARSFRSETLRSSWVIVSRDRRRLTVVIPPTHSDREGDMRVAATLARGLLR